MSDGLGPPHPDGAAREKQGTDTPSLIGFFGRAILNSNGVQYVPWSHNLWPLDAPRRSTVP